MKYFWKIGLFLLALLILPACSKNQTVNSNIKDTNSKTSSQAIVQAKTSETSTSKTTNENSAKLPGNQLNLKVGQQAHIVTNISNYKITLESVKIQKEPIGGEPVQADEYIIAKILIKNVGNSVLKAENVSADLNLNAQCNDIGTSLKGVKDPLLGKVKPGSSFEGTAVFDVSKDNQYKLIDGLGMADQGADLQNKATWTFKPSEAK